MGLKSGSRDSGIGEDEQDETNAEATETQTDESSDGKREETPRHPSVESLPYKLRRHNVNHGREQVPYFLRPEIIDAEDQLKETLEADLGETVYKSDYREAAMVVAQRNPDLIADVLREWGYDLDRE